LPILHALAEGVADERIPVRDACAMALCDAINDRHSYAVPPGILIDVLVHILSPVIRVLGDYLITDLNKQSLNQSTTSLGLLSLDEMTTSATAVPGPGLTMKRPNQVVPHHLPPPTTQQPSQQQHQQHENEWITVESDAAADNHSQSSTLESNPNNTNNTASNPNSVKNELSMTSELMNSSNYPQNLSQLTTSGGQPMTITSLLNIESNVIVKCIETLTTVFMKHVKKLSYYPSFDKLWLQLLQILTYFIELLPGEGEMTAAVVPSSVPVAPSAVMTATTTHLPPPPPNASPSSALYKDIYYQIISQLSKICCVKLEMVIRCLQKEKVFLKKESLWIVTKEFLSQLQNSNPQHPHTQTLIAFLN
jgi:hypothetical protein